MWDLQNLLKEPRLANIEIGSPDWFRLQKEIILSRPLLRHHYDLWYSKMLADEKTVSPAAPGKILEIGSGGGYLKEVRSSVVTSDVVPGIADETIDARALPFADHSLRAIFVTNAFHHIPDVEKFLSEADNKLIPGGVLSMIDPAATPFARIFWTYFHPEPFVPDSPTWTFDSHHHMGSSNQALSWIVFKRDLVRFEKLFPRLKLEKLEYLPWFSYFVTGGVTRKNIFPTWSVPVIKLFDLFLRPFQPLLSLSWHIQIRKVS